MTATTREYVSETRTVGPLLVHAYSILSTDFVAFDVYEPYTYEAGAGASHSTSRSFRDEDHNAVPGGFRGNVGAVRTRTLPAAVAALPFGPERTAQCLAFFAANDAECEDAIRAAFPEIAFTASSLGNGHALLTLDEYAAQA